jgi:hypothetical protein
MAQTNDHKSNDPFVTMATLGVIAMIAATSVLGMLRLADRFRPQVGDIVTFNAGKKVSPDSEPRIAVILPSAASCILDVRTMRKSNGSLIIEATASDPTVSYHVHWAGGPTSATETSCGVSANLSLSEVQFISLKIAASE